MEEKAVLRANAILWSAGASLTFFWILNIFKEAFDSVKNLLNFYPSVGPLLGLFTFSLAVFVVASIIFNAVRIKSQKASFLVMVISAIVFLLMVFPPFFKPIVEFLH